MVNPSVFSWEKQNAEQTFNSFAKIPPVRGLRRDESGWGQEKFRGRGAIGTLKRQPLLDKGSGGTRSCLIKKAEVPRYMLRQGGRSLEGKHREYYLKPRYLRVRSWGGYHIQG